MAAPHIPNLNTLRRGQGRPFGRGRGAPSSLSDVEDRVSNDKIVQQTDQDASVSRLSAVEVGYLDDPYAKLFASGPGQRRFPIINRGTYVRTRAIDNLVHRFLSSPSPTPKQIISLGAGSDTRFFRLQSHSPPLTAFIYHELDFPTNTSQKISTVIHSPALSSLIPSFTTSSDLTSLSSSQYHIHPIDLRDLAKPSENPAAVLKDINPSLPTLLISECCLVYLSPSLADTCIAHFTTILLPLTIPLGLILYEPINPHDAFGEVMVRNLAARGIVLQTLHKYWSKDAQLERLREYG
ncbi:MAG: hypothetical protein Q9179_007580, partial [Wetmoreana sp. 5 TL-2023]